MPRTLDDVVTALHDKGRAASYGAVAGIVGGPAHFVMQGRPRDHMNSWVVNSLTNLPTDYETHQIDPRLKASIDSHGVLDRPHDLDDWLDSNGI